MSALTISKTLRTIRRSITTTIFVLIIADSPRIFLVYPTPPMFCSFSWVLQSCQEKLRIMLTQFFFLGGGGVREAGGSGGEGVNEVHYGQNGKLKTFDVPASTRLQIKKISSTVLGNVKMHGEFKFQNIILGPTHLSSPRVMGKLSKWLNCRDKCK